MSATRASDERREARDEVFHRTRATGPGGVPLALLVVNMSPGGMMARVDHPLDRGDRLHVLLPDLGSIGAEVRWALGGRVGCRFDRPVTPEFYYRLLATMGRAC